MTTLIEVEHVRKLFGLSLAAQRRHNARRIVGRLTGRSIETSFYGFTALDKVTFSVSRGEAVAILGRNGAGKSTLLRIIAGHVLPDAGSALTRGRVTELFDLTTGFDPARSGRDNVALVGVLRGLDVETVRERTDDILSFSELGERLDAPFGSYSQGMKLRLGFSIAVHTEPDILLIDEVLGVGDLQFKNKCLGRLERMKRRTATIFVTHSLSQAANFCDRALVIDGGKIVYDGSVDAGIDYYESIQRAASRGGSVSGPVLQNTEAVTAASGRWSRDVFGFGKPLSLDLDITVARPPVALAASVLLYTQDGQKVADFTDPSSGALAALEPGHPKTIHVAVAPLPLGGGQYKAVLAIRDGAELVHRTPLPDLEIAKSGTGSWGLLHPKSRWSLVENETA
ncbi:polysaccharide ABC transporter ATP-binding protein [Parvularcula dongshanensis]|uniref:Lipopolysaccharide transport system ATP-binding protein n=1 Tax=Parvularcula dongshanensis TaxID=1173995 RepID=A0A840I3V1_9PROT|nr:polysaccharide ABC transporter ATP-binding protein [Parvularcula dongshanensis]MBB4658951.1 lipopolysaccharide transport system ATP-binding protein [Parvularcula dongshanensis]